MMAFGGQAGAAAPPDPSGTRLVEDGRARIRLERCGPSRERICASGQGQTFTKMPEALPGHEIARLSTSSSICAGSPT
jgi:hypothetical protein